MASEAQIRALLDNAPEPIFVQTDGCFVFVNRAALDLYGASAQQDLLGTKSLDRVSPECRPLVLERRRAQLDTGRASPPCELVHLRLDGTLVPVETTSVAVQFGGHPAHVVFLRDVAERRRTDAVLRESEQTLRDMLDSSPFPSALVDAADERILYWSRGAQRKFGHTPSVVADWYRLAYPDPAYRADVVARWKPFLEVASKSDKPVNTGEYLVTCADGKVLTCELYATFLGPYLVVTFNDVTERRQAESRLRLIESAVESASDAIIISDAQGRHVYQNRAMSDLFGHRATGELRAAVRDRAAADDLYAAITAGQPWTGELEMVAKDGRVFPTFARANAIKDATGKVVGLVGIVTDMSERKRAEAALEESEARFRAIAANTPDHIIIHDCDLRYTYVVNPQLGLTLDDMLGRRDSDFLSPADAESLTTVKRRVLETRTPERVEAALDSRSGGREYFEGSFIPTVDDAGNATGLIGYFRNITDRKRAEERLRESEARYRSLVEGSIEGIGVACGNRLIYANQALLEMFGCESLDEWVRTPLLDFVAPASRELVRDRLDRRRRGEAIPSRYEYQIVRRDGSIRDMEIMTSEIDVEGERHVQSTFRDVTDRKRAEAERAQLEDRLHHAQKMEAIGTLAGGVAHDFNNILCGVLGGLSLLELELGDTADQHRADFKDMKDLVRRGSELAKQLLGFSRRGKYDVGARDIVEVVGKTVSVVSRARRDIVFTQDFAPDLDAAVVDHTQLEQVLFNLFINAGHAMPGGGGIMVRGENAALAADHAECLDVKPGRYVKLVVADTGTGIDPAILPRIFEPFFTTKALGQGTGLGLASVYGIVKNHGGCVKVESEVGKGTAFTVLLPAADKATVEPIQPQLAIRPGQGTILVVDDEEQLLKLCARLLRAMGYEVLTASGGKSGLALVRQYRDRLSLVILDMTMPEMSGAATFDAIRAVAPELKVLLASGYAIDGQAQALLDRGCNGFIQKPFDAAALSEKIQSL